MRAVLLVMMSLLLMATSHSSFAQTENDTIRVKEQLPTGLPGEGLPPTNRRQAPPPPPVRTPAPEPRPAPGVVAQPEPGRGIKDRLYTGGNMGLNLFGRFFFVDASPILGYKISEKFSVGPGVVYQYISTRNYSYSNYGFKGFARFLFIPSIFAHAEHEILNVPYTMVGTGGGQLRVDTRTNVGSTFVGPGYRQRFSDRAAMDSMLLFNLQPNVLSPYSNPVLRFGVYYEF